MFGISSRNQNLLLVLSGKTQNCIKTVRREVRKTTQTCRLTGIFTPDLYLDLYIYIYLQTYNQYIFFFCYHSSYPGSQFENSLPSTDKLGMTQQHPACHYKPPTCAYGECSLSAWQVQSLQPVATESHAGRLGCYLKAAKSPEDPRTDVSYPLGHCQDPWPDHLATCALCLHAGWIR